MAEDSKNTEVIIGQSGKYLDLDGLRYYHSKINDEIADKQDAIIPGSGLEFGEDGITLAHKNKVDAKTDVALYDVAIDTEGHISSVGDQRPNATYDPDDTSVDNDLNYIFNYK